MKQQIGKFTSIHKKHNQIIVSVYLFMPTILQNKQISKAISTATNLMLLTGDNKMTIWSLSQLPLFVSKEGNHT